MMVSVQSAQFITVWGMLCFLSWSIIFLPIHCGLAGPNKYFTDGKMLFFYKAGLKSALTWPEKMSRGDPFAQKFENQNAPYPTRQLNAEGNSLASRR